MDFGEFFQMATEWAGDKDMGDQDQPINGGAVETYGRQFWKDLGERVLSTFVAGFVGAVSLDWTNITDLGWKAWFVAGAGAGVVSVVKGLIAKLKGMKDSASLTSEF